MARNAVLNKRNFTKKDEWKTNKIQSISGGTKYIFIFGLIWTVPSFILAIEETPKFLNGHASGLVYLFPLVGIIIIIYSIRVFFIDRRYGIFEFEMDPFPGAIGGDVGGSIFVKNLARVGCKFEVTLSCWHKFLDSNKDNKLIWSEIGLVQRNVENGGVKLTFCFQPPEGLPASKAFSSNYHSWQLTLKVTVEGLTFYQFFDIPVFKTNVNKPPDVVK